MQYILDCIIGRPVTCVQLFAPDIAWVQCKEFGKSQQACSCCAKGKLLMGFVS